MIALYRYQKGFTLIELAITLLIMALLTSIALPLLGDRRSEAACIVTDTTLSALAKAVLAFRTDLGDWPRDRVGRGYALHFLWRRDDQIDHNGNGHLFALDEHWDSDDEWLPFHPLVRRGWRGPYAQNAQQISAAELQRLVMISPRWIQPEWLNLPLQIGQVVTHDGYGQPIFLQVPCLDGNHDGACHDLNDQPLPELARLVSAGPNGIPELPLTADTTVLATRYVNGHTIDDRVLFLYSADPGQNQPCANS